LRQSLSIKVLEDRERRPVLLFENQHMMRWIQDKHPDLDLAETAD
jgi:peptide subunit release factor RF-3